MLAASPAEVALVDFWMWLLVCIGLAIVWVDWSKGPRRAKVVATILFGLASSLPAFAIIWWHCDPWWWCGP